MDDDFIVASTSCLAIDGEKEGGRRLPTAAVAAATHVSDAEDDDECTTAAAAAAAACTTRAPRAPRPPVPPPQRVWGVASRPNQRVMLVDTWTVPRATEVGAPVTLPRTWRGVRLRLHTAPDCRTCSTLRALLVRRGMPFSERDVSSSSPSSPSSPSRRGGKGRGGDDTDEGGSGSGSGDHHVVYLDTDMRLSMPLPLSVDMRDDVRAAEASRTASAWPPLSVAGVTRALRRCDNVTLLPHQAHGVECVNTRSGCDALPHTIVVKWQMGAGKTVGATFLVIALARVRATTRTPLKRVIVVCSNTLIDMWADALAHTAKWYTAAPDALMEVRVVGYSEADRLSADDATWTRGAAVIVDEFAEFRNLTTVMRTTLRALRGGDHVLLLSGTPLVNDVQDVHGFLACTGLDRMLSVDGGAGVDPSGGGGTSASLPPPPPPHILRTVMRTATRDGWLLPLAYDPRRDAALVSRFPSVTRTTLRVPMTWEDVLHYVFHLRKDTRIGDVTISTPYRNTYRVASRLYCNTRAKADALADAIARGPLPVVVHSHFRERGLDMVRAALRARAPALRIAELTGDTPTDERGAAVAAANRGDVDVQLISEAAKVGTNFCGGFRALYKFESALNTQSESQTENRVVRLDAGVPHVHLVQLVSVFPPLDVTPPRHEVARVHAALREHYWPDAPSSVQIIDALRTHARTVRGVTLDEILMQENEHKHATLCEYLDVMDEASLTPPPPPPSLSPSSSPPKEDAHVDVPVALEGGGGGGSGGTKRRARVTSPKKMRSVSSTPHAAAATATATAAAAAAADARVEGDASSPTPARRRVRSPPANADSGDARTASHVKRARIGSESSKAPPSEVSVGPTVAPLPTSPSRRPRRATSVSRRDA